MEFKDKIVLIVGASSGMGRAVAVKLAARGASIVATARRQEKLEALASEITGQGGS